MTKRICIFASYSNNKKINDYVIYYLKGLREVCDVIIFVADCDIEEEEQKKLQGLVAHSMCQRHGEYDFGSYKRGYNWAVQNNILSDADELILCNDSCYGPIYPFGEVFEAMQNRECDFWGLTESHQHKKHLQSFFLVFKRQAFTSKAFNDYICSVKKQESVEDVIISYEVSDIEALEKDGLQYASFVEFDTLKEVTGCDDYNPILYVLTMLKEHMPLLKRKTFVYGYEQSLEESPLECMDAIKEINPTLHDIIFKDIPTLYTKIDDMPKNAITESASLIEQACGGQIAIKVMYKMIEEALEKRPHIIYKVNPQSIVHGVCVSDYIRLEKKTKKHLKQIRLLIVLSSILLLTVIALLFIHYYR